MQQYFVNGEAGAYVTIEDKDTIKHMFNVMRLTEDDQVVLVFDDAIKRLAKVVDSSSYRFQILEERDSNVEMPVQVTIASGFPKGDKLAKIALGAAEQSKRNRLPQVRLFEKKADFQAQLNGFDKIFIAYEESAKEGELSALAQNLQTVQAGDKLLFIFGPEGGISPKEIAAFEEAGAIKVGLGPRIMRTETAPLYALSVISYSTELL
ncbi:TPA: 16S rRNA (uracil(1498)-N(3))-methyltransferase [Streptococcus agalactiae]